MEVERPKTSQRAAKQLTPAGWVPQLHAVKCLLFNPGIAWGHANLKHNSYSSEETSNSQTFVGEGRRERKLVFINGCWFEVFKHGGLCHYTFVHSRGGSKHPLRKINIFKKVYLYEKCIINYLIISLILNSSFLLICVYWINISAVAVFCIFKNSY